MSTGGLIPPLPPPGGRPPGPAYFAALHRALEANTLRPAPGSGLVAGLGGITHLGSEGGGRRAMVPMPNFPFRFHDVSTEALPFRYSVSPGGFLARGQTTAAPEAIEEGSGQYLTDATAPVFAVSAGKDSHLCLRAYYDNDAGVAVWRASVVEAIEVDEDAPFEPGDDWLQGTLEILVCRRKTGAGEYRLQLISQTVLTSIGHTKCGEAHLWWRA